MTDTLHSIIDTPDIDMVSSSTITTTTTQMNSTAQSLEDIISNDNESSTTAALTGEATAVAIAIKRTQGRPRKVPIAKAFPKQRGRPPKITKTTESNNSSTEKKRKPGRPRKITMNQEKPSKPSRPRGRPKKSETEKTDRLQQSATSPSIKNGDQRSSPLLQQPKRGRGRPPKLENKNKDLKTKTTTAATTTIKRGRGRPKKEKQEEQKQELSVSSKIKRGRGRPPKAKIEPEYSQDQQQKQSLSSEDDPITKTQRNVLPAGSVKHGRDRTKKQTKNDDKEKEDQVIANNDKMEDDSSGQLSSKTSQEIAEADNDKQMENVSDQFNTQHNEYSNADETITKVLGIRDAHESMVEDTVIHPIPSAITDISAATIPSSSSSPKLVPDNVQPGLSPPEIIITTENGSDHAYGKSQKRSKEPNPDVTSKKRAKHFSF
ncbi:hypothetical protein BDA99DRAFT_520460 [Phascolomyces articulosus]|uniref:Uncharacterized protein n=1 Tax=Phascolomyces articulosus TaxID=60185 RepID=A0AAD5PAR6_9FUNG|nr:hypothetical protein BDA99DRAFT_520460 [Phascolomyces articulosus]